MKPEHFIYKSDGLYYMQNVPEYPAAANQFDPHDSVYFADVYTKALERAKEEAVKCDESLYEYFYGQHERRVASCLSYSFNGKLGYRGMLIENEIYTINMEENIEVVEIPCGGAACPSRWGQSCIHSKLIARIVAPKKEEESEPQMLREILDNYSEYLRDKKHGSLKSLESFVAEELEKFEIKRKPL